MTGMEHSRIPGAGLRPLVRGTLSWGAALAASLLALAGRYRWDLPAQPYSLRAYLSSAFLLAVTLPVLHGVLGLFGLKRRVVRGATACAAAVLSLPYAWLGLDRFYYHAQRPVYWNMRDPSVPPLAPDWLPGGFFTARGMPGEAAFVAGFFVLGTALVFLARSRQPGDSPGRPASWAQGWWPLVFLALILIQTWMHLGLRSPYVYVQHYVFPQEENFWAHAYLLPQGRGAVEGDYFPVFRDLEEYFFGLPKDIHTMLIRRVYWSYLASQFTYFINPFQVFLVMNLGAWCLAGLCAWDVGNRILGRKPAWFFTFFVCTGTGFIAFASQPMFYLASYAQVLILTCLFFRILLDDPSPGWGRHLLFGAVLGLGALVYDVFPLYVFFLGYGLYKRLPWTRLAAGLALSLLLYAAFLVLQRDIIGLTLHQGNSGAISSALGALQSLLAQGDLGRLYSLLAGSFRVFGASLVNSFFVLPLIPAVVGLACLRDRDAKVFVALMALQAYLGVAFLYAGGSYLAHLPRLAYFAYPALFALAALGLAGMRPGRAGAVVQAAFLLAVLGVNNVDAFGVPDLYYLFYFPERVYFMEMWNRWYPPKPIAW